MWASLWGRKMARMCRFHTDGPLLAQPPHWICCAVVRCGVPPLRTAFLRFCRVLSCNSRCVGGGNISNCNVQIRRDGARYGGLGGRGCHWSLPSGQRNARMSPYTIRRDGVWSKGARDVSSSKHKLPAEANTIAKTHPPYTTYAPPSPRRRTVEASFDRTHQCIEARLHRTDSMHQTGSTNIRRIYPIFMVHPLQAGAEGGAAMGSRGLDIQSHP